MTFIELKVTLVVIVYRRISETETYLSLP